MLHGTGGRKAPRLAGEVGSFVVGTDVIGGSGPGALPGTFGISTGIVPDIGAVVNADPPVKSVTS